MYDLIIENGFIVDGSGNPWYRADLAVTAGKISKIGNLKEANAKAKIDARGLIVSPGFIDIHCHSDALLFLSPREQGKLLQGVTTETIGNCGMSAMPVAAEYLSLLKKYTSSIFANIDLPWEWQDVAGFLTAIEERGTLINTAALVGHGTVRIAVMGFENRDPSAAELNRMKQLVDEAMKQGAFGLSSGLIYPPGVFSHTEELIELCKVVAKRRGFYATHMRGETDTVVDSVKEAIFVAERSGVSLEISHHKAAGRDNWGKSRQTLAFIEAARERGVEVTCDVYPYIAASTMLGALLPPWINEGGVEQLLTKLQIPENRQRIKQEIIDGLPGWENYVKAAGWDKIIIASCQINKEYEGKSLAMIAEQRGIEPAEAVFDLMIEEKANVLMVAFMMHETDVSYILKHPAVMVASDAIPSTGKPHPRYYGTFPRVLAKYVREDHVLSLAEAVRKMTSMPAQKLGLRDRGMLREGMWADITVFDAEIVKDQATFMEPQQYPVGIEYVVVNGEIAVANGKHTGIVAGKVLRKGLE